MEDILIPIHKMVGKNPEIDVLGKRAPLHKKVAKVFLTLEMEGGEKTEFFSDEHAGEPIEITKEFLETYE